MKNNDDFGAVMSRLRAGLGLGSDTALAERLGLERTAFAKRKARESLPREEIDAVCEAAKLNPRWVYEGVGEMRPAGWSGALEVLKTSQAAVAALSLGDEDARHLSELLTYVGLRDRERLTPVLRRLGLALAPHLAIQASAGNGAMVSVEDEAVVDVMAFDAQWLRDIGVSRDRLAVISVRGDSMADTLQDGDLILVDTSTVERKTPGVYVIVKNDTLLVKRLNFKLNGGVEIRSDNKAYPAETLSAAEFEQLHIVGRMARRVVR